MQIFVLFIVGAVILGAGAMLSPAWVTREPRIGLASALCLALIVGGAVFWAMAFGWDTLVIDYLFFALVSGVVLGGTFSQAQTRAEAKGEELPDAEQGWTSARDLIFFALVALVVSLPILASPLPLTDTAQDTAYLTLTARLGGTFDTLAPFYPDVRVLHAPGFHALTAYLSHQLNQLPLPMIQYAAATVIVFLSVWAIYDLGGELRDKRLGRAFALAFLGGIGTLLMLLDGQFPHLLGLLFTIAFMTYTLRFQKEGRWMDLIAAGLMMGAVMVSSATMALVLFVGYVPHLVVSVVTQPAIKTRIGLALGIPLVAILGTLPWLLRMPDLLSIDAASPYTRDFGNLGFLLAASGGWLLLLAVWGAWVAWRGTLPGVRRAALWSIVWLVIVVDFGAIGIIPALLPPLERFVHPAHMLWFGAILPVTVLGGIALMDLWERFVPERLMSALWQRAYLVMGALALGIALLIPMSQNAIALISAGLPVGIVSTDDLAAMQWLKENAPEDARILNHPQHGGWAVPVAERDAIYFPVSPLYDGVDAIQDEQSQFMGFWRGDTMNTGLLQEGGITHILVPGSWRGDFNDIPGFAPVFAQGNTTIYEIQALQ